MRFIEVSWSAGTDIDALLDRDAMVRREGEATPWGVDPMRTKGPAE
jgi:hypothetical protein